MDAELRAAVLRVAEELCGAIGDYETTCNSRRYLRSFTHEERKVTEIGWGLLDLINRAKEAAQ